MKRKNIASGLAALLSYSIANGLPPSSSRGGCFGPNIPSMPGSMGNYGPIGNFGSVIYDGSSLTIQPLTMPHPPGTCPSWDPRCKWNKPFPSIEEMARIFGKEQSRVYVGTEDTSITNPVEYVSSLYGEAIRLWLHNRDKEFVVLREKDNKFEYVGGTLMPISGSEELGGNYVQFVDDNFSIEKFILSDNGKFTSNARIVKVSREKQDSRLRRLNYAGTNFFIEEIIKDESTYTPTNNFLHIDYDNGNITARYAKNTIEDKPPMTNEQSILGSGRNEK
ncbi:hypothetical protein HYV50_00870 [Candidatus Pacearchaeota archaeon]|nr:hypothetical protein [Candidatus Pacearchaeota archaeon]